MWRSISSKLTCTVHWMIGLNVDSRSCQSYSPMQHATYTSNQKHTKENIAWSVSDVRTSIALYFLFVIKFSSSWSCDHWNHLILHQNTFSADCNTFYYTHLSYWWSLKILTLPPVSVADYLCMIYMKFWMFYLCRAFLFFCGVMLFFEASFASLKKAETLFRQICCERKILFQLKKLKSTDYKRSEQDQRWLV